jgi:acetyl esterase/lipase
MVQDFIQKLATVHANPSAKPQLLEQMKNWMTQHGGTDVDTKLVEIGKVFDRASAMSAADFQKNQQDLAWQIFRQMRGPPPGRAGTTTPAGAGTQPGQPARRGPAQLSPGTSVQRDLEYVEGGGRSRSLDLYVPENPAGALPVVVWIHGGGWRSGSKDMVPALSLLSHGYAIASINYRLSGEAPWPAQLDDCKAAIRWLRANAPRQHLDPNHIGVWGSSSGGHLVAMLGVTGDQDSRVQAVCDWSGSHDLVALFDLQVPGENGKTAFPIIELLGGKGVATKAKAAQASPLTHVSRDAAPFLLMHGDRDQLIPIQQSELFDAALRKAGAECKFVVVPGAGHGFGGTEIDNQVAEFFDQHLWNGRRISASKLGGPSASSGVGATSVPGRGQQTLAPPQTHQTTAPQPGTATAPTAQSSLVLYLSFGKPPEGDIVHDGSGYGNDGHVAGATWRADSRHGGALHFDSRAQDQQVRVFNADSLNPKRITIAAWIKASAANLEANGSIVDKDNLSGYALDFGKQDEDRGIEFQSEQKILCSQKYVPVADGQWHHIAATYDGHVQLLYVDGKVHGKVYCWRGVIPCAACDLIIGNGQPRKAQSSGPGPRRGSPGAPPPAPLAPFDGLIGELRIYNRALNFTEIAMLAKTWAFAPSVVSTLPASEPALHETATDSPDTNQPTVHARLQVS